MGSGREAPGPRHGTADLRSHGENKSLQCFNVNSLRHIESFFSGIFRLADQQGYYEGANPVRETSLPQARPADKVLPGWRGWHAFRRGLATNLNRLGVDDSVIQRILRHSDVAVTQACYIKTASEDAQAAMQKLENGFK